MSRRSGLRSAATKETSQPIPSNPPPSFISFSGSEPSDESVLIVPVGSKLPGLSSVELRLLREKQVKLRATAASTLDSLSAGLHVRNALEATLIFAQYEAGTAVCIDKYGWVLTCAHCFGESEEEYESVDKRKWLLFYTGLAVQVECRVWDAKRDLALLKVVTIESSGRKTGDHPIFQAVLLSGTSPTPKMPIFCIGQPGRDDLESTSEQKTKYNLVEISDGTFRGMVKGVDPQDNSEIGTLKHDAWTYWGHSGAPLLKEADGTLIGLHSSWDDQTAMRHGVPQVAIREFLLQEVPQQVRSLMTCMESAS